MSLDFFLTNECVELAPFINVLRSLARKEDTVRKRNKIWPGISRLPNMGAIGVQLAHPSSMLVFLGSLYKSQFVVRICLE